MDNSREKTISAFLKLLDIIDTLHGPQGCPWDKEQNHESLRPYVVEEAYEVVHAIDAHDFQHLQEELGDLLLQILFHSKIASQKNHFEINDVMQGIANKLVRRHPHVFADTKVKDSKEVIQNWEKIKAEEKKNKPETSLLSEIPLSLPALLKAYKIGKKASQVGFDWPSLEGVMEKVKEELAELEQAIENHIKQTIAVEGEATRALPVEGATLAPVIEELGDILFSLANLARHLKINPEEALRQSNEKFIHRFQFIENKIRKQNKSFTDLTLKELDALWEEAKK